MARVFVSYRRADGAYGVGWLAERLRSLDSINEVQTAFHDGGLKAGDNFHQALEKEIADSDLLIAVIGPQWRGDAADGPSRIQDQDDWVVREIAAAFEQNKLVVPVILSGGEHPLASQVHPSIAEIARLHAVRFGSERDLNTIVDQVEQRLREIDLSRARLAGLESPIQVPRLKNLSLLVLACLLVAGICGFVGGWATREGICSGKCTLGDSAHETLIVILLPLIGVYIGAIAPVGFVMARRMARVADFKWLPLLAIVGFSAAAVALALASFNSSSESPTSSNSAPDPRIWFFFAAVLVMLFPWALALNAASCSVPRAQQHELARRVDYVGLLEDTERWAAMVLAIVIAAAVVLAAAIADASDKLEFNPLLLLTFAVLISALLIGSHLWNQAKLVEYEAVLKEDLKEVAPALPTERTNRLCRSYRAWARGGLRVVSRAPRGRSRRCCRLLCVLNPHKGKRPAFAGLFSCLEDVGRQTAGVAGSSSGTARS